MGSAQLICKPTRTKFAAPLFFVAGRRVLERGEIARPFVKWAGGKRSIVNELLARIPEQFNEYYEPFVGGGALFWNVPHTVRAHISDINFHLITTYHMVRDNVDAVISKLKYHQRHHTKKYYMEARSNLSEIDDLVEIAALFIYLNKTCYNGLYRVNKAGIFNVPIGRYESPKIVDAENLKKCSLSLAHASISHQGFSHIKPRRGDFVYFDPPYHETFSAYDGSGFGIREHEELATFCRRLDQLGVRFMLSNSDTSLIRELYASYNVENIDASRTISCKGTERKKENELIIRNYVRRSKG